MLHACVQRFDVMENLKKFCKILGTSRHICMDDSIPPNPKTGARGKKGKATSGVADFDGDWTTDHGSDRNTRGSECSAVQCMHASLLVVCS